MIIVSFESRSEVKSEQMKKVSFTHIELYVYSPQVFAHSSTVVSISNRHRIFGD